MSDVLLLFIVLGFSACSLLLLAIIREFIFSKPPGRKMVRGNVKKSHSIFKDIIEIEVDPPPSHPIFDKFIFDTVLIMLTSLPPIEFLTKIMKFKA